MKKYCSECKQVLAQNNCVVCDKCGKPTKPIGFFDRISADNCLTSSDKRLLEFICVISAIAAFIGLVQFIIMTAAFAGNISATNRILVEYALTEEEILTCHSSIKINTVLMTVCGIAIAEQAATLFISAALGLKKSWAVQVAQILYIINAIIYAVSANIISAAISIYLAVKLSKMLTKMEGGAEYTAMAIEKEIEEANLAADKTKWRCKSCGFINHINDSECKSCGKWK